MRRFSSILLFIVVALFAFGLRQLFDLRFQSGDIYPNYSSLRADPLGTKALYESYEKLLPASRNYRPLQRLSHGQGTSLFLLGLKASDLSATPREATEVESFVKSGGRLVLGLAATDAPERTPMPPPTVGTKGKRTAAPPTPTTGPGPNPGAAPGTEPGKVLLTERWGFELDYLAKGKSNSAHLAKTEIALPASIPFHSALAFKDPGPEWTTVYQNTTNRSVLIERQMGLGTIVIFADSYLFSNEAMLKERQAALLAWVMGNSDKVVFDETHLGVHENTGIMSLARKYRLHGVGVGILFLAGLYVWKNAVPFLPPHPNEVERGAVLLGKDSAAGVSNLLRRNVAVVDLLPACIQEWQKSCGHLTPRSKLQQMQNIIDAENAKEPRRRDPVLIYEAIRKILAKPRRPGIADHQPQAHEKIQTS
jgi:hypothetical protein